MREILFRAKRTDNGEWVEGFYVNRFDVNEEIEHLIFWRKSYTVWEYAKIDPETLCQFTGSNDKNGNCIWENDILSLHRFLFDGSEYEKEIIVSIEYIPELMCFGANLIEAKEIKSYMGYGDEDACKVVIPLSNFYGLHDESFEVIGNIFDNPELLKGE